MTSYHSQVLASAKYLKGILRQTHTLPPELAIILGSGLGAFAETLDSVHEVPFETIPHFPRSSVAGHSGKLLFGKQGETFLCCLQGRVHYYEGHPLSAVTFSVRVMAALGVQILIVTNAAGGINPLLKPGDLMVIRDHISNFFPNPLIGPHAQEFGPRFPDMSEAYSRRLRRVALTCAKSMKLRLREGVYAAVTGPSYETPAEIRMLKRLGADAVGMSTVPEVIVARHMAMECLGISMISNLATGISQRPLDHSEVLAVGKPVQKVFSHLLIAICKRLQSSR